MVTNATGATLVCLGPSSGFDPFTRNRDFLLGALVVSADRHVRG